MVGFGYSDRPRASKYSLDTWADQTVGVMDALGIEKAHLVGNSFGGGIALRHRHQAPGAGGQARADGQHGRHFQITEGLDNVWGYDGTFEDMRKVMGYFAYDRALVSDDLAQVRYEGSHPARLPGVVLVDVPGARGSAGWSR